MTMRTSVGGLSIIKEFEGLRLSAYRCPAGIMTIGYGHTSAAGDPKVTSGLVISRDDAERILRNDLGQYEDAVRKYVKVELTQNQFDALVSFAYNVGVGSMILNEPPGFIRSTLLKKINAKRFGEVPSEFMKWTKGGGKELPGLVRRRRAEAKLWRGLDDEDVVPLKESRAKPDTPKPSKSITQAREANAAAVAGGLSTIAVVQEVMPIVKDGSDILGSLSPTVMILVAIVVIAGAIWWFRKQRLDEEGA